MEDVLRKSGILLVAPLLAYLVGWQYQREHYRFFGIDMGGLDIPIEHYFVQAFGVLYGALMQGQYQAFVVVALLLAMLGLWLGPASWLARIRLPLFVLLVFVVVPVAFDMAGRAGRADALGLARGEYGRIAQFMFTEEFRTRPEAEAVLRANEDGRLRVLWRGSAEWIVVEELENFGVDRNGFGFTYVIPIRQILHVRTRFPARVVKAVGEQDQGRR